MQEQNFEKQVKQKMEELSFSPSEPVWKKVEEQIRKKKDRRRIFFWLLPFILLGVGFYFYINRNYIPAVTPVAKNGSSLSKSQKDPVQNTPVENTNTLQKPIKKELSISKKKIVPHKTLFNSGSSQTQKPSTSKVKTTTEVNNRMKPGNQLKNSPGIPPNNKQKEAVVQGDKREEDKKIVQNKVVVPDDKITMPVENKIVEDSVKQQAVPQETPTDTNAVAQTNEIKTAEKIQASTNRKKNKWLLSAYLTAGISGIATSPLGNLSTGGPASLDALRYYNSSVATTGQGSGQFSTTVPSDIKAGFSFAAGTGISKHITEKLQIFTGIAYHFYSTSTMVGKKVDSMNTVNREDKSIPITNYYQVDNSAELVSYKNQYHFLEVPIGIDWCVLENAPLHLKTGISIGWLMATNALYYDSEKSIYYKDKNVFSPIQFSFYTGLSYRIIKMKTASLYVGPKVQFQITNLLDKKEYGQQHLFFTCVGTSLSF